MAGLRCEDDDGDVSLGVVGLQGFEHLESIHSGHLQVEEDQVVPVLPMQRAHILRLLSGRYVQVPGLTQHLLEQSDIRLLVVDDQNAGAQYVG